MATYVPITVVPSGGAPFVQVSGNAPAFTVVPNAAPITLVTANAPPIVLYNPDGSPYLGAGPFPVTNSILGAGGADYAMYDSSAMDRMWQESTGQTPSSLANPVGLIVGREKQGASTFAQVMAGQPELVTNGTFDTNINGWTALNGGWSWDNGRARLSGDGTVQTFRQTCLQVGKFYRIEFDVMVETSGTIGFENNGGAVIAGGTSGRIVAYWLADRTTLSFKRTGGGIVNGWLDNVSAKEVPAHYASQAVNAARPVLQSDGLKFDGSDDNLLTDWLAQAGANCVIAQVTFPLTVPAPQVFVGSSDADTSNRVWMQITATGTIQGTVNGGSFAAPPAGDLRGTPAIVALSMSGASAFAYANDAVSSEVLYTGAAVATPFRVGARNANGTASSFFGGQVKRLALGKTMVTPAQFQQIRAEWLAAP